MYIIYISYHKSGLIVSLSQQIHVNIHSMCRIQYMQIYNAGQIRSQTFSFSTWNKYISHHSVIANYGDKAWVTLKYKHSSF